MSIAGYEVAAQLEETAELILGFLESKSLFETQRTLRSELAHLLEGSVDKKEWYTSELERRLQEDALPTGLQSTQARLETIEDAPPSAESSKL